MKGSAAHTSHDLPLPFSFWSLKSYLFLIGEVSSFYCLSSQPVCPSPQLLKTLLGRTRHNKTCLDNCHNLCLALWPQYLKLFVGLQVVMWDKGRHFLVTDQTTEGQTGQSCEPQTHCGCLLGLSSASCFPSEEIIVIWRVKYEGCQVPWHCLNGSGKDAAHWQNLETVMQSP